METNQLIERMLNEAPLIKFSVDTESQRRTVQTLGQEILQCLQASVSSDSGSGEGVHWDGQMVNRAYGMFWLWVLGAYEVVRTMCQAEQCFSSRLVKELKDLKQNLARLRIPFAKQELRGQHMPVRGEPSIYGIDHSPPDFRYEANGQVFSVKDFIDHFNSVFSGISALDVLADHRTAYCPE